jgi:hypothetical protein
LILKSDTTLLRTQEIMDYSLLLAVESNNMVRNWKGPGPIPQSLRRLWGKGEEERKSNGYNGTIMSAKKPEKTPGHAKIERFLEKTRYKFISSCGLYIYHISIIDYLQIYNMEKFFENKFKTIICRKDPKFISAVNPELY